MISYLINMLLEFDNTRLMATVHNGMLWCQTTQKNYRHVSKVFAQQLVYYYYTNSILGCCCRLAASGRENYWIFLMYSKFCQSNGQKRRLINLRHVLTIIMIRHKEYRLFYQEAYHCRTAVKAYQNRVRVESELDNQIFYVEYNHLFDIRLMQEIPRNNVPITYDDTGQQQLNH